MKETKLSNQKGQHIFLKLRKMGNVEMQRAATKLEFVRQNQKRLDGVTSSLFYSHRMKTSALLPSIVPLNVPRQPIKGYIIHVRKKTCKKKGLFVGYYVWLT